MIEIFSEKGEHFKFDPSTNRLFRDGYVVSTVEAEPVYSNTSDPNEPPIFSGVFFKGKGELLSLSGKYNQISDINSVI